jgi:phenylacetate-coenzyme A ligase PaaK-like adenylate-forming protein
MQDFYDHLETRDPAEREAQLFADLPAVVARAMRAPGWARHLAGVHPQDVAGRDALGKLPILRKSDLPALQQAEPPLGGFSAEPLSSFGRLFASPGPILEPETTQPDPWRAARALHAAGFRRNDVVLNTFSYHLTPGGFILDSGARMLGCAVIPAGPGNTSQQVQVITATRPSAYTGTPDFLKILIETLDAAGVTVPFAKALVSGAAFPPSLQTVFAERGIAAYQAYATAECGFIAFETPAREGLIVNEDIILEIVRPGTGDPVPEGEVGEVVITVLNLQYPIVRLALGDLSAMLVGQSPCGRTNLRINGWMGRADQTTKIKGLFVRPEQIAQIARHHRELLRLRLVVTREGDADTMVLKAECETQDQSFAQAVAETIKAVTKLKGRVELLAPGTLPNDGKVIADERKYR